MRLEFSKSFLWLMIVLTFASCEESDAIDVEPKAQINIVNTLPDLGSSDIYLDNQKVTLTPLAFTQYTGYLNIYPGDRKVDITSGGLTAISATINTTLEPWQTYSLFVARRENASLILVKDESFEEFYDLVPCAPHRERLSYQCF